MHLRGSVLGPLLFLIYIDDIATLALSESSKLSLYADDMLVYKTISSTADHAELKQDIDLIYSWSTANLMTFNGIWSSSLAPIYGQRYTNIGESSAVWITDLYKALEFELPRLTRHLPVTLTGESEAFPVIVNIF